MSREYASPVALHRSTTPDSVAARAFLPHLQPAQLCQLGEEAGYLIHLSFLHGKGSCALCLETFSPLDSDLSPWTRKGEQYLKQGRCCILHFHLSSRYPRKPALNRPHPPWPCTQVTQWTIRRLRVHQTCPWCPEFQPCSEFLHPASTYCKSTLCHIKVR